MSAKEDNLRTLLLDAQKRIRRSEAEIRELTESIEAGLIKALEEHGATASAALRAGTEHFGNYIDYRLMLRHMREAVRSVVPSGSVTVVLSKGDAEMLNFHGGEGWHFPQLEDGTYAGHYPATSAAAIDHLETLRRAGAEFLIIPATSRWWLEHYAGFGRHLDVRYERILDKNWCVVYSLAAKEKSATPLEELQRNWHEFGKRDPLWAIKSIRKKINRKWKEEEFFRTGEDEIARVMRYVERLRVPLARGDALDFGCGVGRLTQALCLYFERCCGVDIAPSMINLAERYNRHRKRCRYHLNPAADLRLFEDESFDFIYSSLVLQHIRRPYTERYVKEFMRVLRRRGLAVFQMPSEPKPFKSRGSQKQTRRARPLPARAFKAEIKAPKPTLSVGVAMRIPLRVKVKNVSEVAWPALGAESGKYRLWLGSRWLDEGGIILSNDDARAFLPKDLKPTEEVELTLFVNTPAEPGDYILELDLVQEDVAWFKHRGSEAARIAVNVNADHKLTEASPDPIFSNFDVPQMEVHGVTRETVVEWVESSGGTIIDIRNDIHAGPDWLGFRYCATKK